MAKSLKAGREPPVMVFIRKAWLVWMLSKLCYSLRKYAMEGGVDPRLFETFVPQQLMESPTENLEVFNPADFKAKGQQSWNRLVWRSILSPVGTRNELDIKRIWNIMKTIKEFVVYPHKVQMALCQYIRYERFGKNRVVIRRGDLGYQYYYIISGKVQLTYATGGRRLLDVRDSEKRIMGKGDSFGEQAFISADRRRQCTVVCSENCEFLTVDLENIESTGLITVLKDRYKKRYELMRGIIANFHPKNRSIETAWRLQHLAPDCRPAWLGSTESWADSDIRELCTTGNTEYHGYGKIVVADSRHNNFIYICERGACDVLRAVDMTASPLYTKALRPHTTEKMQDLTAVLCKRPGITLMDNELMGCQEWWPDYMYAKKLEELRTRYERGLYANRDPRLDTFIDQAGKEVRGSTINVLSQIVSHKDEDPDPASLLYGLDKDKNKMMILNALGTSLTFKRTNRLDLRLKKSTPHGVYMQVGHLTRGAWFGIQDLWGEERHCSLVSRGCTLIRFPKSHLFEMMDFETVKSLKRCLNLERYPADEELSREATEQLLWRSARNEIGKQTYKHMDYAKKNINFVAASTSVPRTIPDRDYSKAKYYSERISRKSASGTISTKERLTQASIDPDLPPLNKMVEVAEVLLKKQALVNRKNELQQLTKKLKHLHDSTSDGGNYCSSNVNGELHPLVAKELKEKLDFDRKVDRLFMKVRLRALQRLVHKEETGDTSPDEESVMADLYRVDERMKAIPMTSERYKICPSIEVHKHPDPVLSAGSRIPHAHIKSACKPHGTGMISYNGVQTLHLIDKLHSPLTKSAARILTKSYD